MKSTNFLFTFTYIFIEWIAMSDYVKQLEAQNEELQKKLAESEIKVLERDNQINREAPRWIYYGAGIGVEYDYGNYFSRLATIRYVGNKWATLFYVAPRSDTWLKTREFDNVADAKDYVESVLDETKKECLDAINSTQLGVGA